MTCRRGTAVLAAAGLLLCSAAPGAAADTPVEEAACPVIAAAQGLQVMVSKSDDLFLAAPSGAALPAAQACVDYGVRDSSGFAGAPYPGQTVVSAPGLLRTETGQPIPDYPAYAASRHPSNEESKVSEDGYSLSSRSSETSSEASARAGLDHQAGSSGTTVVTAKAAVVPDKKSSEASATSDTQPLLVNDTLRLGQIHSSAKARTGPDGKVHRSSRLRVGRTTVAGQEVEITSDGLRGAGQDVVLPQADPSDALEAAGVRVRYLEETKTERGVLSAGIEVFARQESPDSGETYTLHYTFGRAFAAASKVEDSPGASVPGPVAPPAEQAEPTRPETADPAKNGAADSGQAGSDSAPEATQTPDSSRPEEPALAAPAPLAGEPADMGIAGLYLVLVFGALAMVAGTTLLRLMGVRTRWTS